MSEKEEVFSKILEKYYSGLTAAEKRIADYILSYPHESVTFSVTSLAECAGTSEATVVRFARSLGFKGFLELKNELLKRASQDLASSRAQRPSITAKGKGLEAIVADTEIANIRDTIDGLDHAGFMDVVKFIRKAPTVFTLGSGVASFLARFLAYQLTLVGKRSICLPDGMATYVEQLATASPPADVLFVFSFPPYSKTVIEAIEFAVAQQIPVLAVTDRQQSPVAGMANAALFAANKNILPSNSITASLVLVTALLAALAPHGRAQKFPWDKAGKARR